MITVQQIMNLDPCEEYTRERVTELWGGKESLTLVEICDLPIPVDDVIWAVSQLMPEREARLFACDCAESVLHLFEDKYPNDKRPRNAIEVARRHANGEATFEGLKAERAAARAAARAAWAAREAAGAEARAAERAAWAAREAAGAEAWAAGAAARAAREAARAAGAAERQKQLAMLRGYCERLKGDV